VILQTRDLARRSPPAGWEAYFLIGVFPIESSLRWLKVQLYSGAARHSLAAVEGMDRTPQRLIVAASKDEVFRDEQPLRVSARDRLHGVPRALTHTRVATRSPLPSLHQERKT